MPKADLSFEHVKYRNLICIMYNFPGSFQYSFPQNIITTQTLQIIYFNSMSDNFKIDTFLLKIPRLLSLKDFGKNISKFQEN